MSRKLRLFHPGAFYHVLMRGNAKQAIFGEDRAYHQFEQFLAEGLEQYKHRLHAYCWMGNHVHMLLQCADTPLSEMMRVLSQRYTYWFNRQHDRVGHLFQGRYKSLMVDTDRYLLELVRYIHLNPVRAEFVDNTDEYPWSSHHAYLGRESKLWLTTDWVLRQFHEERAAARNRYLRLLGEPVDEEQQVLFASGATEGGVIGSDDFLRRMEEKAGVTSAPNIPLEQVVDLICEQQEINRDELCSASRRRIITEARAVITLLAVNDAGKTLTEVADYFARDITVLSRQMKKLRERSERLVALRERLDQYRIMLKKQVRP